MKKELQQVLGISGDEADVYLALLRLGQSTLMPIVRATKLPLTSTVQHLDKLAARGFIEIISPLSKRKRYEALPPQAIHHYLTSLHNKIDDRHHALDQLLPQLDRLYSNTAHKPQVQYFDASGIDTIAEAILEEPIDEVCYFSGAFSLSDFMGNVYAKEWTQRRVAKKINSRTITTTKTSTDRMLQNSQADLRQVRHMAQKGTLPSNIMIYGNHVAVLLSSEQKIGMVVSSREFAATMQAWFNQLWRTL